MQIRFQAHNGFFILAVFSFWVSGISVGVCAQKLPAPDADKLLKAQHLAKRVHAATRNATGAAKVLEEAGITELIQERPADFVPTTYAELLETYASLLAQVPDRRPEAAALLKTVIETAPERTSAYYHLGDLYYQLYRAESQVQHRAIYMAAYRKYVDRLRMQQQHVLLSSPVIEAAYASDGLDICGFTGRLLEEQQLADLDLFFNPETEIKNLSKTEVGEEGESGISFSGFVNGSADVIRKSFIDVDNDGHPETRYSAATITNHCRRNVFYRHIEGQSSLLSNHLLDSYYRPDHVCGGSRIFFVRYLQQNYLLEQQPLQKDSWKTTIFQLTPAGGYSQLCTIEPPGITRSDMMKN